MKSCILFLIAAITTLNATAQKLPNKQEASFKAPANIKIDGKATEWGDLKAYNTAIEAYYKIANDDKNLYFILTASEPVIIRKIIAGGVTLSVKAAAAGNDKVVSVTYPLFDRKSPTKFNFLRSKDAIANRFRADTFMLAANKDIVTMAKQIKVNGAKTVRDTLSIYNEEGIMAASSFNNQVVYTYELALPLKYLRNAAGGSKVLAYNIRLNGSAYVDGVLFERVEGGMRRTSPIENSPANPWPAMEDMEIISVATDMSGTYTLAL